MPTGTPRHPSCPTPGSRWSPSIFGGGDEIGAYALDVRAAKAFLRERPEVIGNSLGIAGASIGANLAVLDAADDPGVLSIALLSPGSTTRG